MSNYTISVAQEVSQKSLKVTTCAQDKIMTESTFLCICFGILMLVFCVTYVCACQKYHRRMEQILKKKCAMDWNIRTARQKLADAESMMADRLYRNSIDVENR